MEPGTILEAWPVSENENSVYQDVEGALLRWVMVSDFDRNELQPMDTLRFASMAPDCRQTGILLCRDLIFTTKVQGTAQALGYHLEVISDVFRAKSAIESLHPQVIFIDLTAGKLSDPDVVSEYVKLAGPDVWLVAFGPHVDGEALAKAKAVGCQIVLPRSKFADNLPTLMRSYYSQRPGRES